MARVPADTAALRDFGERVRAARNAVNWSQEQLAEYAGMDRTTVSKIERGVANPTLLKIHHLLLALKLRHVDLFPEAPRIPHDEHRPKPPPPAAPRYRK